VEVNSKIALVGKAVIGVKAEAPEAVKEALPPGWTPELKYEINPGGEVELLVFDMANNSFSQGKDVASIVAKANSVLAAAGLRSPEKLKALKAKSITKILKEAREEQEAAKQNAADRKDYDKAYNPKQQQSGGEVSPLDELDSCE
jgi:hypothetical protein